MVEMAVLLRCMKHGHCKDKNLQSFLHFFTLLPSRAHAQQGSRQQAPCCLPCLSAVLQQRVCRASDRPMSFAANAEEAVSTPGRYFSPTGCFVLPKCLLQARAKKWWSGIRETPIPECLNVFSAGYFPKQVLRELFKCGKGI